MAFPADNEALCRKALYTVTSSEKEEINNRDQSQRPGSVVGQRYSCAITRDQKYLSLNGPRWITLIRGVTYLQTETCESLSATTLHWPERHL